MFRNYFKSTFRNLRKNKILSAINILGLTIGLTSCLLIGLYIRHELSYDDFEQKGDRLARVVMEYKFSAGGNSNKGTFTSTKVAPVFKRNFPEVENVVRMMDDDKIVRYGDKLLNEHRFLFADSTFFDMFTFPLLRGNAATALNGPNKVVLTASAARRYFGEEDPVGKVLEVGSEKTLYEVTGLMKDCPSNSQIKFDFLASFSSLGVNQEKTYWEADYRTYVLLKNAEARTTMEAKLPAFMKKEMQGKDVTINFYLEPFKKIHLYSEYPAFEAQGSIRYIYILSGIAALILLIACFTYVNLSTARSVERAKEVGVRKVIGAGRQQLFWQFMGESAVTCFFAIVVSFVVAELILPAFNQLTGKQLQSTALFSFPFVNGALLITVMVCLAAGSYPSLILSKFQAVKVLKGTFKNTGSGQWLRKSLIVFQFIISVALIISTFIMQQQLNYIRHKKLGYDRSHVLVLPMFNSLTAQLPLMKAAFKSNPDVLQVSRCMGTPVQIGSGYTMRSATMPATAQLPVTGNPVDEEYVSASGLQLIAGTDLTAQDLQDISHADEQTSNQLPDSHFIINETAASELGWTPASAIGKKMFLGDNRSGYVRGVVKDFHFASLHTTIRPLVLFAENRGYSLIVKLSGTHLPETLTFLEAAWKKLVPGIPFEYRFLEDDYNKMYTAELRLGQVMDIFSVIAIVLACLGLFGLSSYMVQQRFKEVGIRKVLGATMTNIAMLLSGDFLKLTGLAILIAIPIAWGVMQMWLKDFAYRITMEWWYFAAVGAGVLFIALVTVSSQAVRMALADPLKGLRTE